MISVKNNKYFKKWKWFILLFIICGLIVSLSLYIFVDKVPERELAENFVLMNKRIQAEFGEPLSVESIISAEVSYKWKRREGEYTFYIKGGKKTGTIRVRWHSKGKGVDFAVKSIELLEPLKVPRVIWPSNQTK